MVTEQYINAPYGALDDGDGVYGDAIIADGAHKLPAVIIPLIAGDGVALAFDAADITLALNADLRAFAGFVSTGGGAPNFVYQYNDGNNQTGSIIGGYASLNINDTDYVVRVEQLQYNTNTFEFDMGISLAPDAPTAVADALNDENLTLRATDGSTIQLRLGDATRVGAQFGAGNTRSGYTWSWTRTAQTQIWTGGVTHSPFSLTAPITPLNYVPHARPSDYGDFLNNVNGQPGWGAISAVHLPNNILAEIQALQEALGKTTNDGRLNELLYYRGTTDLATAFPPANLEPGAIGYAVNDAGTQHSFGVLVKAAGSTSATANRNRVLLPLEALSQDVVSYGNGAAHLTARDNYHDVVKAFEISLVAADNEAEIFVDIDPAVYGSTPAQLYMRLTGYVGVFTLARGTGRHATDGERGNPRYYVDYYQNAAEYAKWRAVVNGITREGNSLHEIDITFFSDTAGLTPVNFKPATTTDPGGNEWQSVLYQIPTWVTDPNERLPSGKVPGLATNYLQEGTSGPGRSVPNLSADYRTNPTGFTPAFDLDDADKQRGILEIEVEFIIPESPASSAGVGFGDNQAQRADISAFHSIGVVRQSKNRYSASAENGEQFGASIRLTRMFNSAVQHLGNLKVYAVHNANNELQVYTFYEGIEGNTLQFTYQSNMWVTFRHEDTSAPSQNAEIALVEQRFAYPASGASSVSELASGGGNSAAPIEAELIPELLGAAAVLNGDNFLTANAGGTGTDYFTLAEGVYAIDLHCQYTNNNTTGGLRASPEVSIERSSDAGANWAAINDSVVTGYKKGTPQGKGSVRFGSTCHIIVADAAERFRIRYDRYIQHDTDTGGFTEILSGRVTLAKWN